MWARAKGEPEDVEAGVRPLYPMMAESPELRWAFVRKIYSIPTVQMLLAVASVVLQLFLPFRRISLSIYGALAALIFCGFIIYDTDNLIKRYSYDEYIWAAVALYLDIINLFLSLLTIFRASQT